MLDLHAVSSGGSTGALGSITTILLGSDGQSAAGVPISPTATLMGWGGLTTIADTIAELKMFSQDCADPINGEDINLGASSLLGILHKYTNIPYKTGVRTIQMNQNTGAANNIGYYMDYYNEGNSVMATQFSPKQVTVSQVFGGALTALTWRSQAFAPATTIPAGKYAILGARVNALTNYGLVRFAHADFGQYLPGFPVTDMINTAVANANLPKDPLFLNSGYQFVYLSHLSGKPLCPIFTVSNTGTGLNIQAAAITADTPNVTLNLAKVG